MSGYVLKEIDAIGATHRVRAPKPYREPFNLVELLTLLTFTSIVK